MGLLDSIKKGLEKTRKGLQERLSDLFKGTINQKTLEELEEALILADVGPKATQELLSSIKEEFKKSDQQLLLRHQRDIKTILREKMIEILGPPSPLNLPSRTVTYATNGTSNNNNPAVLLITGVNGVGKTTTIGKLCYRFRSQGKSVIIAASDTFRAAAIEQLEIWAKKTGAQLIKHQMGSDPAAVAFDAVQSAKARNTDIVIIDTAGRLHTKTPLMEELKKIKRVVQRVIPEAPHESLLVLDATTGQNALQQARLFNDAIGITGIALTKLDGSSKGGIVFAIRKEFGIPVKLIGIGEGPEDLEEFNPEKFVEALLE
jgi:fused signal recognition particle receptor